jgi:hypothetical protein
MSDTKDVTGDPIRNVRVLTIAAIPALWENVERARMGLDGARDFSVEEELARACAAFKAAEDFLGGRRAHPDPSEREVKAAWLEIAIGNLWLAGFNLAFDRGYLEFVDGRFTFSDGREARGSDEALLAYIQEVDGSEFPLQPTGHC